MGFDSSILKYRGSLGTWGRYKDIDNPPLPGLYDLRGNEGGLTGIYPSTVLYGVLIYIDTSGGYKTQIAILNASDSSHCNLFIRLAINGVWLNWTSFA